MKEQTIAEALNLIFAKYETKFTTKNLYDLHIAQLFHDEYGIIVNSDYLPNIKMFYPHVRTRAYSPMTAKPGTGFGNHLNIMSMNLKVHKGSIKECYLKSIMIAITYIAIKINPHLTNNNESFDSWTFINIALELDKYDEVFANNNIVSYIVKTVDKDKLMYILRYK